MLNRLGLAIHEFLMDPIGCLTSRKGLIWSGVALLVVAVWLRWPRIERDMVRAISSEWTSEGLVNEYRANWPFRVRHEHAIRGPVKNLSEDPLVFLGSYTPMQQTSQYIDSRYDWLRGEYYVRLAYSKIKQLPRVRFGDQFAEFPPKLPATDNPVQWQPTLEARVVEKHFVSGDVVHVLNELSDQSFAEYILVYVDQVKKQ